jgi:hypothetical protein
MVGIGSLAMVELSCSIENGKTRRVSRGEDNGTDAADGRESW